MVPHSMSHDSCIKFEMRVIYYHETHRMTGSVSLTPVCRVMKIRLELGYLEPVD